MEVLEFVIVYMDKIIFGNGLFSQLKPKYIEIPNTDIKAQKEFMEYIIELILNTTGIPKNKIKNERF